MPHKLAVAAPRLASTVLVLARNPCRSASPSAAADTAPNSIQVLMMKRHGKARFMPSVYVFPGGGIEVADYVVAQDILRTRFDVHTPTAVDAATPPQAFMEAKVNPSPAEGEAEAWSCRVGALRELAEEAACVLHGDATMSSLAQWQSTTPATTPPRALFDVSAASALRPVGRWVTPRHFKYRYDTYFYAALVAGASAPPPPTFSSSPSSSSSSLPASWSKDGAGSLRPAQDVPLVAQASEVEDLLWVSPLEALRRHENTDDAFCLAPPTFLLLHALARQPSYEALAETWSTQHPSPPVNAASAEGKASCAMGTLPYSSVLPCVEPRSRVVRGGKHIEHFMLPEHYLYERAWSEPAGAYRFCEEAFRGQRHQIRMWVGEEWAKKAKASGVEDSSFHVQDLTH